MCIWELRNCVLPSGISRTIRVNGKGKIAEITAEEGQAAHVTDLKGLRATGGLIDAHVHDRFPGNEDAEDWPHLSRALVAGGIVHFAKMPNTNPAITRVEQIEPNYERFGVHVIQHLLWFGVTPNNFGELRLIAKAKDPRIAGVKMYMGSSTGDLLVADPHDQRRVLELCAELGLTVAVHAEDENIMQQLREKIVRPKLIDHCQIRSTDVEVQAVKRIVRYVRQTGCRVHFCHISTPESLVEIQEGKQQELPITVEVCPHHLFFHSDYLTRPDGWRYKMNPPLRTPEQIRRLHKYLPHPDWVDIVATDHAPHTLAAKQAAGYDKIPSGLPGVETMLPLLVALANRDVISFERLAQLTTENPAKMLGLTTKGKLEPGYDADIVAFDPNDYRNVRDKDVKSKCGWTPFNGMRFTGFPKLVMVEGKALLNTLD